MIVAIFCQSTSQNFSPENSLWCKSISSQTLKSQTRLSETPLDTSTPTPNFTNLIVFARFKDEEEFVNSPINTSSEDSTDTTVKQLIDNSYSKAYYSVKDYFYLASNGHISMNNIYLFDTGLASLELSHDRGYYYEYSESNTIGYTSSQYELRMNELKQDWSSAITNAIDNGRLPTNVDGTETHSLDDLDKNNDGKIDSITIIYKYSNAYNVQWKGCLWNYQSYCNMIEISTSQNSTITSDAYVQMSYDHSTYYTCNKDPIIFANLKTMIHETGHIFGLKDLYNSSNNSPVYYMSAMSNAIAPVPQYISAKEREVLGWLSSDNIKTITSTGEYTISVTSSTITQNTIAYKLLIPSSQKTLYLEYRKFDGTVNKYDTQSKTIYTKDGDALNLINIKSGLVCFLLDKDTTFPNNMYSSSSNWNYQVLGGTYGTKVDSPLQQGESLPITTNLSVSINSMNDNTLTFKIEGNELPQAHTHNLSKVNAKASTCTVQGNTEYYVCSECNLYFSNGNEQISLSDTLLPLKEHSRELIPSRDATCTQEGLTSGYKCSECGTILEAQDTISKIPHTPSDWIIDQEPTTTEQGSKHTECTICHKVLDTATIPIQEDSKEESPEPTPPTPTDPETPSSPTEPENPTTPTPSKDPDEQPQGVSIGLISIISISIGIPIITLVIFAFIRSRRRW